MTKQAATKISIVSPVYGSANLISVLCARLHHALQTLTSDYEIILVFDCSPDDGWEKIQDECRKDQRVKGVLLSRNFGQHYAITAGLTHARGEWIVVMDCDLQDQPEAIPELMQKAAEGFDVVFAERAKRQDTFLKRMASKLFYALFAYMTDSRQNAAIGNFGVYHHRVVKAILAMQDKVRYFPTMIQWVGFKQNTVCVEHAARQEGKSNYSLRRLLKLALDNMIAFSDKPLRLTVLLGMMICLLSFGIAFFFLARFLVGGIEVSGFTSLILSIWFLAGMVIFILGILGIYIGRSFDQVKNRPTFIVSKTENVDEY